MTTPAGGDGATAAGRGGGAEDGIHTELWNRCAGPLVTVPRVGDKVYYFPQGHIEQVEASTNQVAEKLILQHYSLPWKIPCEVMNVELMAEPYTDEVYAQLSLLPETKVYAQLSLLPETKRPEDSGSSEEIPSAPPAAPARPRVHSFYKILSASDTSLHGSLTVRRCHANECLPPLDTSRQPPTQELVAKDIHGVEWCFQHVFRGLPKRHILQGGWSVFVSAKRLVAGDAFIILRGANGELRVGFRRAMRQQANVPCSVISSQSMHIGVLATAWYAVNDGTMFTVCYKPRTSPAEFVVPCDRFIESLERNCSIGMRFKMVFEGGKAPEQTFTGTIAGVPDADPATWPESKWRSLKVSWDEDSSIPRPEWVSPWQIEPAVRPYPINPLPVSRPKRLHRNDPASLQRKLSSDGWMQMKRPESSNEMLPGFQQPKDIQNPPVFCSSSEQISAAHSNCWHTVNANYQDQQVHHNMFPRMQDVGGLPQSCENTKFSNAVYAALPGHATDQYSPGLFDHVIPSVNDAQLRLMKPQPMTLKQCAASVPEKHLSCAQTSRSTQGKSQSRSTRSRKKVHRTGIPAGRSVDLTKFKGYRELIAELDELFDFNGELKGPNKEWMVVYIDNEGDMMLVGDDDPWNEFCDVVDNFFICTTEEMRQICRKNQATLLSRSEDSPANSMGKELHCPP